ncbi:ABC transporter ATP-binding protein [Caldilinea sp.]|uniref:ABC transporter ATP-binding protein n=1 Tax=Caldilinea sp. TaxID=2293560 RepID=UPI0021DD5109|nr:ABC transporter ATP-binding protein [Caldilinea sp.]GIV68469.1 MAG: ABC transporter [Caldilinea sp.]
MTTSPYAVEMRGITKRFPGVLANDRIDFQVRKGEIHALLGENGAGKSTLMNILSGLYRPDEGEIAIHGRVVEFHSPRDAIRHGVGMVHQHFMLTPSQSVAENVFLGAREIGFVLNPQRMAAEVRRIAEQYRLPVDPNAKIWQLSVGEQQRVEIIKILYRGAEILILDEPTAVLTPQEAENLFVTLRSMAADNKTIIFISHKLEEVLSIADRITVLRSGRVVATLSAQGVTKTELANLMVGRQVLFQLEKPPAHRGEVRLRLDGVCALDDKLLPALRNVSLTVHSGEIVGVAGVAGNGQRELAEVICGLRPLTAGTIEVAGERMTHLTARRMIDAGVAYVPEDRNTTGSAPNLSVAENLILKSYRKAEMGAGPFLDLTAVERTAASLVKAFNILTPSIKTPVRKLSGGNLQKVILAREISSQPKVLIAASPTRGLDIGATESVRSLLLQERSQGAAILLISEDLDEIFAISDRIVVLYEGCIMGEFETADAELTEVGLLMAGGRAPSAGLTTQDKG